VGSLIGLEQTDPANGLGGMREKALEALARVRETRKRLLTGTPNPAESDVLRKDSTIGRAAPGGSPLPPRMAGSGQ